MHSDDDAINSHHHHHTVEKSFRINHDERFFSKLMAKETNNSSANTSSRVFYYGEKSVAVPFMWEAQPGTPKHHLSETSLPPLTPPPSYYSNSNKNSKKSNAKRLFLSNTKANTILSTIWPTLLRSAKINNSRKKANNVSPSSSWSTSSSSLSSSSWSLAYSSPSFSIMRDKVHLHAHGRSLSSSGSIRSPPLKHKCSHGFRGCYPFGNMRKNATV